MFGLQMLRFPPITHNFLCALLHMRPPMIPPATLRFRWAAFSCQDEGFAFQAHPNIPDTRQLAACNCLQRSQPGRLVVTTIAFYIVTLRDP